MSSVDLKKKLKSHRLSINLTGSRKELLEVKAFWCKKLCYIWDDETKTFTKLIGLDNGIKNIELYECQGLNISEQSSKRITYGYNEIDVPIHSIFTLLVLEALTPFYIFQVFSLVVWLLEDYYLYAIAIIVMSVFGIGSSIIQTRKVSKCFLVLDQKFAEHDNFFSFSESKEFTRHDTFR